MKWYKLDKEDELTGILSNRPYLRENDWCVYAREYQSGKDYRAGETNSFISNFKKSASKIKPKYGRLLSFDGPAKTIKVSSPQSHYRREAVGKFKEEIKQLFKQIKLEATQNITVTAIPSSKRRDDPEYDNRFEDLFNELAKEYSGLCVEWPVEIKQTVQSAHGSTKVRPFPEQIKANYSWKGFKREFPKRLYVFDDVITTGAHFRAFSDFLRDNEYNGEIVGVFWAKAIQFINEN